MKDEQQVTKAFNSLEQMVMERNPQKGSQEALILSQRIRALAWVLEYNAEDVEPSQELLELFDYRTQL